MRRLGAQEVRADAQHVHTVEEYAEDVERGDDPERCDGKEEGTTDADEEIVHAGHKVSDRMTGYNFLQLAHDLCTRE
ncbi:hypothetical protein BOVATA_016240 [Babesia ovata]|uniref:Uncharacterized protein n=1 Tax=Babesia ovata TaxID=189622 RepID=A0A2H6KAV8_9APIC|nr:uncharacterized protein BOVATA_016240 [Babesia ovata]GBE60131.1 hypothetical protein BOVATA_016240 [Babesia ovata]